MIIDIHGHYTTEPLALHAFRDKQLAGLADAARSVKPPRQGAWARHGARQSAIERDSELASSPT